MNAVWVRALYPRSAAAGSAAAEAMTRGRARAATRKRIGTTVNQGPGILSERGMPGAARSYTIPHGSPLGRRARRPRPARRVRGRLPQAGRSNLPGWELARPALSASGAGADGGRRGVADAGDPGLDRGRGPVVRAVTEGGRAVGADPERRSRRRDGRPIHDGQPAPAPGHLLRSGRWAHADPDR